MSVACRPTKTQYEKFCQYKTLFVHLKRHHRETTQTHCTQTLDSCRRRAVESTLTSHSPLLNLPQVGTSARANPLQQQKTNIDFSLVFCEYVMRGIYDGMS